MDCLAGALSGYALTIVSLFLNSLWVLILGRAVTGFTAGNQPIAQAAMIDGSTDAADRDRNMGYIVTGVSFGPVSGPIIGALLSDRALLGGLATFRTPFYGAFLLAVVAIAMVLTLFQGIRSGREKFVFRPMDVIDSLAKMVRQPRVLDFMPVYAPPHPA